MATVEKLGKGYRITVSTGYDISGKQLRQTLTWVPDAGMSEMQIAKELERQKILFEEKVRTENYMTSSVKFEIIAKEWIEQTEKDGSLKFLTLKRYKECQERIYQAIGHLPLGKITTRHIQKFVNNLSEDGINKYSCGVDIKTVSAALGHSQTSTTLDIYAHAFGEANRYFGVELEIDRGGELEENARELLDIGNREKEHIYIKHDGSLSDGMEIVTHPMTLDYHIKNMNWDELAKKALAMDYRSHKTSTCGFHIHVNRSSFSDIYAEREERIANVFYIVEKFWDRFLIFSRRTADQLAQWASRYGCGTAPKDVYKNVKENYYGRYKCINDQNDATIEFRVFRGTLRTNTIIATLQMVNEICNVAVSMSEKEFQELTWDEFVDRLGIYPELMVYMHERGLVNMERVQEEE